MLKCAKPYHSPKQRKDSTSLRLPSYQRQPPKVWKEQQLIIKAVSGWQTNLVEAEPGNAATFFFTLSTF